MIQNQQEGQCGWREVSGAEKGQAVRESTWGIVAIVQTLDCILSEIGNHLVQ